MANIYGIPVPSVEQIVIGAELVFVLLPFRVLAHKLENDMRLERKWLLKHHIKNGHEDRFKRCVEGYCFSLRNLKQDQLAQQDSIPELDSNLLHS
jgi:hypothetical protein